MTRFTIRLDDQLLTAVAGCLSELVLEVDSIARFGGDEFVILISEVETIDDVIILANKIAFSLGQPFILDNHTVNLSARLGIAIYSDHDTDMDTILSNADAAMYETKN